ncbi:MAG: STAS domain-containing protein [Labilithrix sp.]|nr:STAS domain-containing protein [Labilithrix sp.]
MRRTLRDGYGIDDLRADVLAGVVVGVVALPLSMALAIAVGAPPQHGLYTAIVAGASSALFGGCKLQVTGPTAAFVVILAPIVSKHGLSGLLTAGFMAGVILIVLGAARLGALIRFVPYPVTTGFTTGIATVIATLQIKDVFGLRTGPLPDRYVDKLATLWAARGTASVRELAVAAGTLALLVTIPRVIRRIPAPLIAIAIASSICAAIHRSDPDFAIQTIGSRFHTTVAGVEVAGIPGVVPAPALPWGSGVPSLALLGDLLGPAFAIAMLGAIESLLSAVIADGMTNTKHDPNAELVGLGIGNMLAPIFGGIAATGALARTATNVRGGARSPVAAVAHAVFVLLSILLFAPFVADVPMASLAALLLVVAWNMSEVHTFARLLRVSPRGDRFVLVTCLLLTVFFDMVVAVAIGFVLAAVLFMRRMAEMTESSLTLDASRDGASRPPRGVVVYAINGPLFFGAAQKAMALLFDIRASSYDVLVIHVGRVSVIDATGFVALENAIGRVVRGGKPVVLAGPLPEPRAMFDEALLRSKVDGLHVADTLDAALRLAAELAACERRRVRSATS